MLLPPPPKKPGISLENMTLTFPKDRVGGFGHLVGYECLTSFRGWLKVGTGHGNGEN